MPVSIITIIGIIWIIGVIRIVTSIPSTSIAPAWISVTPAYTIVSTVPWVIPATVAPISRVSSVISTVPWTVITISAVVNIYANRSGIVSPSAITVIVIVGFKIIAFGRRRNTVLVCTSVVTVHIRKYFAIQHLLVLICFLTEVFSVSIGLLLCLWLGCGITPFRDLLAATVVYAIIIIVRCLLIRPTGNK